MISCACTYFAVGSSGFDWCVTSVDGSDVVVSMVDVRGEEIRAESRMVSFLMERVIKDRSQGVHDICSCHFLLFVEVTHHLVCK